MKTFSTSPEATEEEPAPVVEFELDGEVLTAKRPKVSRYLSVASVPDDSVEQIQALFDFAEDCLDVASRDRVRERLDDPDDPFDLKDLIPILNWITEQFSGGRPTTRPSASRQQRRRTGSRSTGTSRSAVQASTPEDSTSTAS